MGKKEEKLEPGSSQDAGAPQDETPGVSRDPRKKNTAPGEIKEKPKPGAEEEGLLDENADIDDETTI